MKEAYACNWLDPEGSALRELLILTNAFKPTAELWAESYKQGEAALKILLATYPSPRLYALEQLCQTLGKHPVPAVVFGGAAVDGEIPLEMALFAFLSCFVSNIALSGAKLIPLGQTNYQKILVALEGPIQTVVERTLQRTWEDLGTATPLIDFASVNHETQHTRIFQS